MQWHGTDVWSDQRCTRMDKERLVSDFQTKRHEWFEITLEWKIFWNYTQEYDCINCESLKDLICNIHTTWCILFFEVYATKTSKLSVLNMGQMWNGLPTHLEVSHKAKLETFQFHLSNSKLIIKLFFRYRWEFFS